MSYKSNKSNTHIAKVLRRNMTPEEKHLWYDFLKYLPVTVHRQKTIGNYIVDFYIAHGDLVSELDGRQHFTDEARLQDFERDEYLRTLGMRVVRFTNSDINKNFNVVCNEILSALDLTAADMKPKQTR